jgi:hypothetical protein
MSKYLCLQRNLTASVPASPPSPNDMQEMYAKFNSWREKYQSHLVDLGGRLGKGRLAASQAAPSGPLIEVKELIGGYMIISAQSLDDAIQIASECPGLVRPGSGVEVIEIHSPG